MCLFLGFDLPPDFVPRLMGIVAEDIVTLVTSWRWTVGMFFSRRVGPSLEHHLQLMWSHCCLHSHPDQQLTQNIEEGLQFGFRVSFDQVHPLQSCAGNHPSAIEHPAVVWEHVWTEVTWGSLVGLLPPPAAECVQVSPLGLVASVK